MALSQDRPHLHCMFIIALYPKIPGKCSLLRVLRVVSSVRHLLRALSTLGELQLPGFFREAMTVLKSWDVLEYISLQPQSALEVTRLGKTAVGKQRV